MSIRCILTTSIAFIMAHSAAQAQGVKAKSNSALPSKATEQAIRELSARNKTRSMILKNKVQQYNIREQTIREFSVKKEQIPDDRKNSLNFNAAGQATVPFAAPNSIILRFEPDVSKEEIAKFMSERNLEIVQTYPKIGAVKAEGDFSAYFKPKLSDNNANDAVLRGLTDMIKDFSADPRILSATPDTFQRTNTTHEMKITNLLTPSDLVLSDPATASEVTDWGITDIEADQLWSLPGAQDGVLFGVMDVGFARHEDLTFIDPVTGTDVDDHGNHVAAIACARHGNNRGIKGVLPNCFVRARSGDVFFKSTEGSQVTNFFVLFSQVLATLEKFVDSQDEVRTFNVSLGYNWRGNFGINPDLPESGQWRTLVASQGAFLVPLLELADENGRVIFSAAGNDSSGLTTPIKAKFASPFNWAALTAREQGIASNGVIVEAHDDDGKRASFSNVGGHLSCPGVNVFSAVAFGPNGQISPKAYGKMSGTSMASPYCASGLALFNLVRPGYAGTEAVDCLTQSSDKSSSGTPMLRLKQALQACPAKS